MNGTCPSLNTGSLKITKLVLLSPKYLPALDLFDIFLFTNLRYWPDVCIDLFVFV